MGGVTEGGTKGLAALPLRLGRHPDQGCRSTGSGTCFLPQLWNQKGAIYRHVLQQGMSS